MKSMQNDAISRMKGIQESEAIEPAKRSHFLECNLHSAGSPKSAVFSPRPMQNQLPRCKRRNASGAPFYSIMPEKFARFAAAPSRARNF